MNNYIIENTRCVVSGDALDGKVIAEIQYDFGSGSSYLTLVDVDGIPNLYKSTSSLFNTIVNDDFSPDDLDRFFIDTGDYDDITMNNDQDWYDIYRCLVYMVHCSEEDLNVFMNKAKGKHVNEVVIPEDLGIDE